VFKGLNPPKIKDPFVFDFSSMVNKTLVGITFLINCFKRSKFLNLCLNDSPKINKGFLLDAKIFDNK
jgi:hypothetical protein